MSPYWTIRTARLVLTPTGNEEERAILARLLVTA